MLARNLYNNELNEDVWYADPVIHFHFPDAMYYGYAKEKMFILEPVVIVGEIQNEYRYFTVDDEKNVFPTQYVQIFTSSHDVLERSFNELEFDIQFVKKMNARYNEKFNLIDVWGDGSKCIEVKNDDYLIRIDVLELVFASKDYGTYAYGYDFWNIKDKSGSAGSISYIELINRLDGMLHRKEYEQLNLF